MDNSTPPSKYTCVSIVMSSLLVESMVIMRQYHICRDVWDAVVGQEFPCKRKDGNRVNPFAVAVARGDIVIGHPM